MRRHCYPKVLLFTGVAIAIGLAVIVNTTIFAEFDSGPQELEIPVKYHHSSWQVPDAEFDSGPQELEIPVTYHHSSWQVPDTIQLCVVAGGLEIMEEMEFNVKSMLMTTKHSNIHWNFIVGNGSAPIVSEFMDGIITGGLHAPGIEVSYKMVELDPEDIKKRSKAVQNNSQHHGGVWAASKLFYPELFPEVEHCLLMDTDMLAYTDIYELWKGLEVINTHPSTIIMMQRTNETMGITSEHSICSCLMLQHFGRMRAMQSPSWHEVLLEASTRQFHGKMNEHSDQSMMFAVLMQPEWEGMIVMMDISWNLTLCFQFYGYPRKRLSEKGHHPLFFGMMHLNCLGEDPFHGFLKGKYPVTYPLQVGWVKEVLELPWSEVSSFEQSAESQYIQDA